MGAQRKTINWFWALSLNLKDNHKSNIFWHHVSRWCGSINKKKVLINSRGTARCVVFEREAISPSDPQQRCTLLYAEGNFWNTHWFRRMQMLLYPEGARIDHGFKLWMCHMTHVRVHACVISEKKHYVTLCGFYWLVDVGSWDAQKIGENKR